MDKNKTNIFSSLKKIRPTKVIWALTKVLAVIIITCIIYGSAAQSKIADSVVRLHIVANSDSDSDQAIKLKVRDAILENMKEKYPDGATKEEAANYLKNSLDEIEGIASEVLSENGSNDLVNAKYGVYPFPTKEYDEFALPAGEYEAVRVELGSAKGENWWCIMFPPLCVADESSLKFDEEAMSQLKEEIGAGNFQLITDITGKGNAPIKIKFRIVEIIASSKIRLAELFN